MKRLIIIILILVILISIVISSIIVHNLKNVDGIDYDFLRQSYKNDAIALFNENIELFESVRNEIMKSSLDISYISDYGGIYLPDGYIYDKGYLGQKEPKYSCINESPLSEMSTELFDKLREKLSFSSLDTKINVKLPYSLCFDMYMGNGIVVQIECLDNSFYNHTPAEYKVNLHENWWLFVFGLD